MKKTIFVAVIILTSLVVRAQNKTFQGSFVIIGLEDAGKLSFYTKAIEAANFEQYRLSEQKVTLEFSNGFKVELLSAKDCFVKGYEINMNDYLSEYPKRFLLPTFFITETRHITALYNNPRKN